MASFCDLSIIIVSWNVWPILAGCLRSIEAVSSPVPGDKHRRQFGPAAAPATLEVIVVDNASTDPTVEYLPRTFPWVRFEACSENLGFTRGNNRGYALSRGSFVYFLNPDTELDHDRTPARDSLWALYSAIVAIPRVGMVGPQLHYADGQPQESVRRFPTHLTGFFESTWLGRWWRGNPWDRRLHMADWPVPYRRDVDWLVGAAMLCRREALEEVRTAEGPFDERFFMYSEEVDLCRRLKLEDWRVVYVPESLVTHFEGKSSDQANAARHIHFNSSKVQYYDKWFDPPWPELLRRYLLLEFRLQLWVERAKLLLRSQPELRRQRIDAYRQVIASGLRR